MKPRYQTKLQQPSLKPTISVKSSVSPMSPSTAGGNGSHTEHVHYSTSSNKRVPAWSWFKRIETIGAGAFGVAYLVEGVPELNGGLRGYYVIKRMFLQGTDDVLRSAATEVKVLEMLEHHPNIINYYVHFVDDEGYINIVMEYCQGGDLEQLLRQRKEANVPFTLEEVLYLGFQLLVAVRHLHRHGVVHRDLKPSNIFICASDGNVSVPRDEARFYSTGDVYKTGTNHRERTNGVLDKALRDVTGITVKIADFGIAKVLETTQAVAKTVIGTPFYISPELCNGESYSSGADIWAIGCIIFEIAANGEKCFFGDNMIAIVRKICSNVIPPLPPQLERFLRPLLIVLLEQDEKKRITADDTLRHFFTPDPSDTDFADDFEDPIDK